MKKDFDAWNEKKKKIHNESSGPFSHKREVWWCSLGVNVGFEQDGTGENYERPVLILRGFNEYVSLVLPLTSSTKKNKYHVLVGEIQGRKAFAIISQIRFIDSKRLINKVGVVNKEIFENIRKIVKDLL